MPIPSFTPARDDAEGEDAESKTRRLLETAGFVPAQLHSALRFNQREAPKGADALSGASSTKTGIASQILRLQTSLGEQNDACIIRDTFRLTGPSLLSRATRRFSGVPSKRVDHNLPVLLQR